MEVVDLADLVELAGAHDEDEADNFVFSFDEEFVDTFEHTVKNNPPCDVIRALENLADELHVGEKWRVHGTMGIVGFIHESLYSMELSDRFIKLMRHVISRSTVFSFLSQRCYATDEDKMTFNAWHWIMYNDKFKDKENQRWLAQHLQDGQNPFFSRQGVRRPIFQQRPPVLQVS